MFCNGGIAAEFCLLYLIETGCKETLIDFTGHYMQSWFSVATLGALCCACGDTFSSEIGSVFGSGKYARLITSFKKVPRGKNRTFSKHCMFITEIDRDLLFFGSIFSKPLILVYIYNHY